MILTVGNVKGGVGKTTLAINLAIALTQDSTHGDVLLIDGDEQQTAMAFTSLRTSFRNGNGPGYTAVALHGTNIRTQVRQLARKYSDIVIDVGGRDTGSLRAALTIANIVLVPLKPRSFDLWGAEQTAELVREAREVNPTLRAIAVINEADPQSVRMAADNLAAASALEEIDGLELAPLEIVRRKAFPNAAAAGLSVLEYGDPKAKDEFTQLTQFLFLSRNDIGALTDDHRKESATTTQ